MAEHRALPPSPQRLALARQAGLHPASPWLVGAAAAGAGLLAAIALGRTAAAALGEALARGLTAGPVADPGSAALAGAVPTAAALALPILAAAAAAAGVAHLAQTGAVWLPRRRIAGAPALDAGAWPRVVRAAAELTAAAAIAGAGLAWLWSAAPRIAGLIGPDPRGGAASIAASAMAPGAAAVAPSMASRAPVTGAGAATEAASAAVQASPLLGAAAGLVADLVAALVIAWFALGVLDALARRAALSRALAMTAAEQRDADRRERADPRWRARRLAIQRGPALSEIIAGAALVVLGDAAAVAVVWHPVHCPIPMRAAIGRGPERAQLVGLARRSRIAIHRDAVLAEALAGGTGPIAASHWPRLAEIIAATRRREPAARPLQR
jgi:flagellar biosynthesis protein FlhB